MGTVGLMLGLLGGVTLLTLMWVSMRKRPRTSVAQSGLVRINRRLPTRFHWVLFGGGAVSLYGGMLLVVFGS